MKEENYKFLTEQIITYIGNKRLLLGEIENILKPYVTEKVVTLDLFSGSGIVARFLKHFSSKIIVNDLEHYSYVVNSCFLSNTSEFDIDEYNIYLDKINQAVEVMPIEGIICNNYAPKDDNAILKSDRVFYTRENAILIDSYRFYIDKIIPESYRKFFLAKLITEASIHVNTSGVFKGFYKDKNTGLGKFGGTAQNALKRIKGKIDLSAPILSNFVTDYEIFQEDANSLVRKIKNIDIAYLDPPYNQHPYGSNYFMLNLILDNKMPKNISKISGIPTDWNRSSFNNKNTALLSMEDIIKNIDAKVILVSYNNEGFISYDEMVDMLKKYGKLLVKNIKYNTFRGSRNLGKRDVYTKEYLFLLNKE